MTTTTVLLYILIMASVTYFVRALPLVLIKKKITNRFLLSFLHYIPYAVLSAMTIPACLYATGRIESAIIGTVVAFILAYCKRSLLTVAAGASATVFIAELVFRYVIA